MKNQTRTDAQGQYQLSGVNIMYTFITRAEHNLTVTDAYGLDAYGFGVTQTIASIPAGVPFTAIAVQLDNAALSYLSVNLNLTLNEDGTGSIDEGSFYPSVDTTIDEDGNCITNQSIEPISDQFNYESMSNGMLEFGLAHPGVNVLGFPGISSYAGQQLGLLGLSDSDFFEDFPVMPSQPTLCDSVENCFPFTIGDIDGSGTVEIYPDVNMLGIPEHVPAGAPLTGLSGGYFLKKGLNTDEITSMFSGNIDPDFYLEWHGVDGVSSGVGLGNDEALDEDGDGTLFDRQLGIPSVTATYMKPECGFNQPVFGDLGSGYCVDYVATSPSGYLMDPSGGLAIWGNFLTAHAVITSIAIEECVTNLNLTYEQCIDSDDFNSAWLTDDSEADMDPSCLDDGDPTDCSGRLIMNLDTPCVAVIEAREVVDEYIEVTGSDCSTDADVNGDNGFNVLDIVELVNEILLPSDNCSGDMNNDGTLNVLDVVILINCMLQGDANCGNKKLAQSDEYVASDLSDYVTTEYHFDIDPDFSNLQLSINDNYEDGGL